VVAGLMLEGLQHVVAVEHRDVLGLRRRDAADRPDQLDVVGLVRRMQRVHADFLRQMIALAIVAGRTRRDHVEPRIPAAARDRQDMVARQELTPAQLRLVLATVHAAIAVAREQECVGDLATEAAWDVNESDEADNRGGLEALTLGMKYSGRVDLEDFGLAVDDKAQSSSDGQNRHRLERRVECQTPHWLYILGIAGLVSGQVLVRRRREFCARFAQRGQCCGLPIV
jgi:hypothetical protein